MLDGPARRAVLVTAPALVAAVLTALATVGLAQRWRPVPARFARLARARGVATDGVPVRPGDVVAAGVVPALVVLVVVLLSVLVHPLVATAAVVVGTAVEPLRARRRARAHDAALREQLPDLVDLFRSAVDAGLTVGQAVDAVGSRLDGPCGGALHVVRRRVALGERRAVALEALHDLGEPIRPLVSALIASERDGAPLGVALRAVADDARLLRRRAAEEAARRLPVQLLFPLVLCILPAFGLLTVVPLLAGTLRSLTV